MLKNILVALVIGLFFTGCVKPDKNRAPSVAEVSCPETARVGVEVGISVVSTDPDGDRIAYQVAFGNGIQSEWSDFLVSGEAKAFLHTYDEPGDYGIKGIASDEHRKNSGWSEETYIEVTDSEVGPHRIILNVGPNDDFDKIRGLGVTTIHDWSIYWYSNNGQDYLDKAHQAGLKVMYSMEPIIRDRMMQGLPWDRGEVDRIVRMCDEHPAVSIIEVMDEPDMAYYDPRRLIPKETQREIVNFIRARTDKPLMVIVSGGVSPGWDLVEFSIWDIIGVDHYVWNGTGEVWGEVPIEYFDRCCKKALDYFKEKYPNQLDKIIYVFQSTMEPAEGIDPYTPLPEGIMQLQFDVVLKYNLIPKGLALWGWNGGFYGPATSEFWYEKVKAMFDKIN